MLRRRMKCENSKVLIDSMHSFHLILSHLGPLIVTPTSINVDRAKMSFNPKLYSIENFPYLSLNDQTFDNGHFKISIHLNILFSVVGD